MHASTSDGSSSEHFEKRGHQNHYPRCGRSQERCRLHRYRREKSYGMVRQTQSFQKKNNVIPLTGLTLLRRQHEDKALHPMGVDLLVERFFQ